MRPIGALQWSCNFIVTEMTFLSFLETDFPELQWSCNFIVTEITQKSQNILNGLKASMEL